MSTIRCHDIMTWRHTHSQTITKLYSWKEDDNSMIADILLEVVLPIFVLIGFGIIMQYAFKLDLYTLAKINFTTLRLQPYL